MSETASTAAVESTGAPDSAPVDTGSASSPEFSYGKVSDDQILGIGEFDVEDEDEAAGEAPADEASAKPAPVEAKSTEQPGQERKLDITDPEAPISEVIEPEEMKALFKQHPSLRDTWYREKAYKEVYPTVAEARAVKEFFPTAELAKQASDQQALLLDIDRLYTEEPAQFASKLIQSNPGAFKQFMDAARPVLHQLSPTAYRTMVAEPIVRDLVENFKEITAKNGDEELAAALEIIEERLGFNVEARNRAIADQDPRIRAAEQMRSERAQSAKDSFDSFSDRVHSAYWDGLHKVVAEAIGKPTAMSDKAVEMVSREIVEEVADALAARTDLQRIFEAQKRNGDFSAQHQAKVADFVLRYARQIVPTKARARLTAWTNDILRVNAADIKKKVDAPVKKDIGAGSGASTPKAKSKKINYRTTSDDDILASD